MIPYVRVPVDPHQVNLIQSPLATERVMRWTIDDDRVLGFFQGLKDEGTFSTVFYDGTVKTPRAALAMMRNDHNAPVFFSRNGDLIAVGWLNGVSGDYAFAHFAFRRAAWGKTTVQTGLLCMAYWMHYFPFLNTVIGLTPETYTHALSFVRRIGFKPAGQIPSMLVVNGERVGARISYFSRFEHGRQSS